MRQLLAIAAGGAVGALLRYWVSTGTHAVLGRGFPYGTFTVNFLGSLMMGFLYVWLLDRIITGPVVRAFLLIGLLGGFTTFSTFSIESLNLIEAGQTLKALVNVLLSVTACITAAGLGVLIARQL
ncbi:MAG: fluoride efflux transporter CrcB [Gammaproteobacteria bacterium]|jgi:fluoride exporter